MTIKHTAAVALWLAGAALSPADYDLSWWTVDGGGAMGATGGTYTLSGTIGQPDAGKLTGGSYALHGGFWAATAPGVLGDVNCDGVVDFGDINVFVLALSNPAAYDQQYPGCPFYNRDINGDGQFTFADINPFVNVLVGGGN